MVPLMKRALGSGAVAAIVRAAAIAFALISMPTADLVAFASAAVMVPGPQADVKDLHRLVQERQHEGRGVLATPLLKVEDGVVVPHLASYRDAGTSRAFSSESLSRT
jgi:hypothetical protein